MTTTTTTPVPTSTPSNSGSNNGSGRGIALAVAGVLVGAAVATGLVYGLGSAGSAAPAVPSSSTVVVDGGGSGSATHHHVTPVQPVKPVQPSAAIETLQRELGQLNYYEGPVTGIMNTQTTQAITYLQRDAHLPQTGTMNAATQAALANFLANGNNQMGS